MALPRDGNFLAPRRCLREPIAAIFHSAHLLDRAVGAHLAGDRAEAEALIREADMPEVAVWTDSLWGRAADHPDQRSYLRVREDATAPPTLPKAERVAARMPTSAEKRALVARWGHHCGFCGIPLVRAELRKRIGVAYPDAVRWGGTNDTQHAAFQCLWLQYDHVLPHARGGGNELGNLVVTCAGCNYGRGNRVLAEQGLIDPRIAPVARTSWDGLERFADRPSATA